MRAFSVFALVAVTVSAFTGVGTAADPTAKAYTFTITRPPKDFSATVVSLPHTSIGIVVTVPDRAIIGLDPAACKLTLTDDKGTNLVPKDRALVMFPFARTDPTRTQASFLITVPMAPAEGATKLRVKGNLVLLCGKGEKTATADSLTLRAGEKATAGPAKLEVVEQNKSLLVRVTADEPTVKTVLLLDQNKKMVGQVVASLSLGDKGKIIQQGYNLAPANVQAVSISVTHYEKMETVTVAVDTEIGVGG